ncbi:hypothetical protein MMC22_002754 [Lobaria immixta]|nr:hypothetical protein [Lobaria immixta]
MYLVDPDARSPLGEPIDDIESMILFGVPRMWHMRYWLDIYAIEVLRGEDEMLMSLRINIEQHKIPDQELKSQVQTEWITELRNRAEDRLQNWSEKTLESEEAQPYLRDIDRMLVDKGRKARDYLRLIEIPMCIRVPNIDIASMIFQKLSLLYRKLNRVPNGTNGVHNQAARGPEVIDAGVTWYDPMVARLSYQYEMTFRKTVMRREAAEATGLIED